MNKIVVITGAGAGVGRAVATEFARHDFDMAILSRDAQRLEKAAVELRSFGIRVLPIPTDVADSAAVDAAAERTEKELGPISVWVNVAMATVFAPVHELTAEEVQRGTAVDKAEPKFARFQRLLISIERISDIFEKWASGLTGKRPSTFEVRRSVTAYINHLATRATRREITRACQDGFMMAMPKRLFLSGVSQSCCRHR
jgi:short chain dehydrogenase